MTNCIDTLVVLKKKQREDFSPKNILITCVFRVNFIIFAAAQ